jgi:tRNA-dihydrouridine synthase
MRLGWDDDLLAAPQLAAALEQIGTAAITVHGRTRQQGFYGGVNREAIRETVQAVQQMPVIANGDIRTVQEAQSMFAETGCSAIAIAEAPCWTPGSFGACCRLNRD